MICQALKRRVTICRLLHPPTLSKTKSGNTPERVAETSKGKKLLNPFDTADVHQSTTTTTTTELTTELSTFVCQLSNYKAQYLLSAHLSSAASRLLISAPLHPPPTHTCTHTHLTTIQVFLPQYVSKLKYRLCSRTRSSSLKDKNSHERTRGASLFFWAQEGTRCKDKELVKRLQCMTLTS